MPPSKPPITCHILDTVAGIPAPNIPVRLCLCKSSSAHATTIAEASTNEDGRVLEWKPTTDTAIQTVFDDARSANTQTLYWVLKFRVEEYFKGEGFFSDIDIKFKTSLAEGREHWHVPLLLSPWSYTTYRGS